MYHLRGIVVSGLRHFRRRMLMHPEAFRSVTGENLFPGTINVKVDRTIPIKEDFRLRGTAINEPDQDFIFEICRIKTIWAYRIRPLNLKTGRGGHGDNILEITCSLEIPDVLEGDEVEVSFFRNKEELV